MQTFLNQERIKAHTMKCPGGHVPPGKGSLLLKQLVYQKSSLFLGVMGWNGAGRE